MKAAVILFCLCLILVIASPAGSQEPLRNSSDSTLQVMLLGTRSGPLIDPRRTGIGTLVVAGSERLLFDVGRGVPTAIRRMGIAPPRRCFRSSGRPTRVRLNLAKTG